jgi:broad specificity phosphatase PhoE
MPLVRYLTHPQVVIDPAVAVPRWGLSDLGRRRAQALSSAPWLREVRAVISSAETKAVETAELLAAVAGRPVTVREGMHENDRSATGFLPPPEFAAVAARFFAHPESSICGWETARAAQRRIRAEVDAALAEAQAGDVLLVGHGGVGRLLLAEVTGQSIPASPEQPDGGGNLFAFDRATRRPLHGWRTIEDELAACGASA